MPGSGKGEEAPVILSCFQGSAFPLPSPLPSQESAFALSTFPAPPFSPAHLSSLRNPSRGRRGALDLGKEALGAQCHPDTHKVYRSHLHPSLAKQLYFFTSGEKALWYEFTVFLSSPLLLCTFPFDRHSFCSFQFERLMNILLSPGPFKNKS